MADIPQAISSLDAYLGSWTDRSGGVHGYIIHHHRDYAVVIAPACWTQGLRILGHLDLFGKTVDDRWLNLAARESRYLVGVYQPQEHLFHDSTTPLTLINNAWPVLALLRAARAMRDSGMAGWEALAETARDNIERRMIPDYWDPDARTFFFCPKEYPSKRVHTYNQNAITISALCAYAELTGDPEYVEMHAVPTAEHMVLHQDRDGALQGGWGYNDGDSAHLYYYLYTALNTRGLLDIYEHTKERRFLESAGLAGQHLAGMIDEGTGLFSHRYVRERRRIRRYAYPAMIAASGLGFLQIRRLEGHGFRFDVEKNIQGLLSMQLPHGGFPTFIGSSDIWTPKMYPVRPGFTKWRDRVSVPFWNVFTVELLVDLLEAGSALPEPIPGFPLKIEANDGYTIEEDEDKVRLVKTATGRTWAFFEKKRDYMLFSTERMRGVPFGAFANNEVAAIRKQKRRVRILAAGCVGLLAALLVSLLWL